ncbi:hypothetical protein MTO96_011290 [Rhipicephalus appendiculatus]
MCNTSQDRCTRPPRSWITEGRHTLQHQRLQRWCLNLTWVHGPLKDNRDAPWDKSQGWRSTRDMINHPGSSWITGARTSHPIVTRAECLIKELPTLTQPTQLYIIVQFIEYVFDRATFGAVSASLQAVCETVSGVTSTVGVQLPCKSLEINEQVLCTGNIKLKVPSTMQLEQCVGDYLQTCKNKKPVTEQTILGLVEILACLVKTALESSPIDEVQELACLLVTLPAAVIGSPAYHTLEPFVDAILETFKIDCSPIVYC